MRCAKIVIYILRSREIKLITKKRGRVFYVKIFAINLGEETFPSPLVLQ